MSQFVNSKSFVAGQVKAGLFVQQSVYYMRDGYFLTWQLIFLLVSSTVRYWCRKYSSAFLNRMNDIFRYRSNVTWTCVGLAKPIFAHWKSCVDHEKDEGYRSGIHWMWVYMIGWFLLIWKHRNVPSFLDWLQNQRLALKWDHIYIPLLIIVWTFMRVIEHTLDKSLVEVGV